MADLIPMSNQLDQTITDIAGQLSPSSKRVYLNDVRHFVDWIHRQGLTPDTMSRSNMIAYRLYLAESTYAKVTKQRMFSIACKLMKERKMAGYLKEDIAQDMKGFKGNNEETTHKSLSKAEAKDMLDSIERGTKQGKRNYALILMLIKTGMRRAELVALNRSDIKIMDGHHVAIIEHGKGDKRRIVKLRVDVYRALEEYLAARGPEGEALFVSFRRGDHPTGNRMTDKAVELLVKKYAPTGTDLTPHGLRATFATLALEAEASLHQVQYALGHADPRTTERYQRRKPNLDNNAVDVLNF